MLTVSMFGWLTAWTHGSIYGSCAAVIRDPVHIQGHASVICLAKQGCAKDVEKKRERLEALRFVLFTEGIAAVDINWSICSPKECTYGGLNTAPRCFMAILFRPTYINIAFVTPGSLIYANTPTIVFLLQIVHALIFPLLGSRREYECNSAGSGFSCALLSF